MLQKRNTLVIFVIDSIFHLSAFSGYRIFLGFSDQLGFLALCVCCFWQMAPSSLLSPLSSKYYLVQSLYCCSQAWLLESFELQTRNISEQFCNIQCAKKTGSNGVGCWRQSQKLGEVISIGELQSQVQAYGSSQRDTVHCSTKAIYRQALFFPTSF